MTDFELAYRKAEIRRAWRETAHMPNSYNHYARRLTENLLRDLMDYGLSFENAFKLL